MRLKCTKSNRRMLLKENPFKKKQKKPQLSEYDHQYNGNKITYLFFLCGLIPNDPGTTALVDVPHLYVCYFRVKFRCFFFYFFFFFTVYQSLVLFIVSVHLKFIVSFVWFWKVIPQLLYLCHKKWVDSGYVRVPLCLRSKKKQKLFAVQIDHRNGLSIGHVCCIPVHCHLHWHELNDLLLKSPQWPDSVSTSSMFGDWDQLVCACSCVRLCIWVFCPGFHEACNCVFVRGGEETRLSLCGCCRMNAAHSRVHW